VYSAAIPQRADMVLERCTNAVATPFGVTGALPSFNNAGFHFSSQIISPMRHIVFGEPLFN